MPIIVPDTSNIDSGVSEPGTYKATISAVTPKTSKAGNPMLEVNFDVMVEGKARKRRAFLVITGEGAYGFDQLLRATGFSAQADAYSKKDGEKPPFDTDWLVGQELNVRIDTGEFNGNPVDEIKGYLRA